VLAVAMTFAKILDYVPHYSRYEPDVAVFGEESGGLQAQITPRGVSRHGNLICDVGVRNVGSASVWVPKLSRMAAGDAHHFEAESDGTVIERPDWSAGPGEPLRVDDVVELKPGEAICSSFDVIVRRWIDAKSYEGEVRFVYRNKAGEAAAAHAEGGADVAVTGVWTGELRSGNVHVWRRRPWPVFVLGASMAAAFLAYIIWSVRKYEGGPVQSRGPQGSETG